MDIFVGSLPFKLTEEDLKKLFEQFGEVNSAKIIIDKITRQNKGFGFIEMPNDEEGLKAIEALNGSDVMGRNIVVNKSEKREKSDAPRTNERRIDHKPSFNSNDDSKPSGNKNFGENKVKGGGFKGGGNFNKGGGNKGGNAKSNKGFSRGGKRGGDDFSDNHHNY